jgi:hypothetical protein
MPRSSKEDREAIRLRGTKQNGALLRRWLDTAS